MSKFAKRLVLVAEARMKEAREAKDKATYQVWGHVHKAVDTLEAKCADDVLVVVYAAVGRIECDDRYRTRLRDALEDARGVIVSIQAAIGYEEVDHAAEA